MGVLAPIRKSEPAHDDIGKTYVILGIQYMKKDNFDNSDVESRIIVYLN